MQLQLDKPWKMVKAKLMEHNVDLTEADLRYEEGKEDELLDRLAKKMGRSTQEIKEWIESASFND
ncbi:MAG: general stress protein CsbD [Chitinophagaceae bacterium]